MIAKHRYQTRSAQWSDVSAIVALRNASSQSTRGKDVTAIHWQKRHWHESGLDLESDTVLVLDGVKAISYAELAGEPPYIVHEMAGAVHPAYRGQGLGTELIQWAETRAQQNLPHAPKEAAIFIQNSLFDSNQPGRELFDTYGFNVVREFIYLQIEMKTPPPKPTWPEGIDVRPLQNTDWSKVGPALSEAFRDHWGQIEYQADDPVEPAAKEKTDPSKKDPEAFDPKYFNSPGLCFVAWDGDQVAGSCLCNATTVEFPQAGYLGSLSVRRPWRGRGLGLALTQHALRAFFEQGTTHVITDTDSDSLTQAYRVYQKTGMHIFRRELVYEKIIRPGKDYVKRGMAA